MQRGSGIFQCVVQSATLVAVVFSARAEFLRLSAAGGWMRLGVDSGEVPHDIVYVVRMGMLEDIAKLAPLVGEIAQ